MAGDWIKMRTSLLTNPKVNGIARVLEESRDVTKSLSTGYDGPMKEIVTRNVMRHVTVSSLLVVWGAANEHTKDGIFSNADTSDIDDMVGIPGFGKAMESVGWLISDAETNSLILPNFNEYNTSGSERTASAKTGAQRQKEYRERQTGKECDVTRDVTSDVTSDRREEKRREEKEPPTGVSGGKPPRPSASTFEKPEWIPAEPWSDFVAMRRAKGQRAPFTVAAAKGIVGDLQALKAEGQDAGAVLRQSVINGWSGVFAVKPNSPAAALVDQRPIV